MIHFGAAGVFGAPPRREEPPPEDQFRAGDIWLNSRGTPHRVLSVAGGVARLVNELNMKTITKAWDATGTRKQPWIRLSCGKTVPRKFA